MLGNKLLVTALGLPAHRTPDLARLSLKASLSLCFMSLSPSLGFRLVSVISQKWNPRVLSQSSQDYIQFSSVQSLSRVWIFATPWTAAREAFLSINNSQSLTKLMSIESVMPSNPLIFCRPLLLLPSIFTSIRVFSNESALLIKWPKYWSFSCNISSFQDWSPLGRTGWISLQPKGLSSVISSTTIQKHQFLGAQTSLWSKSHIHTWLLEKP